MILRTVKLDSHRGCQVIGETHPDRTDLDEPLVQLQFGGFSVSMWPREAKELARVLSLVADEVKLDHVAERAR